MFRSCNLDGNTNKNNNHNIMIINLDSTNFIQHTGENEVNRTEEVLNRRQPKFRGPRFSQ